MAGVVRDEQAAGVGEPGQPGLAELETADLIGGAEPVLQGPDHPQLSVPVALEVQHHVDQVLQGTWPGDGPLLRDMPHEHRAQRPLLGHGHQGGGDLPDLGHPAGRALDPGRDDRLHRVDDEQHRLHRVHLGQHGGKFCLGGDVEVVPHGTDPVRAQPHLGRRLLTGDVQHRAGLRHQRACLEQQRGLAHARLPGQQHHRSGDQSAAQHPVEFVEPGGPGARRAGIDLGDRHRAGRGERVGGTPGQPGARDGGNRRLLDRSPGLAAAAAPGPFGGPPSAVRALIQRRGGGITHGWHGSGRVGHQCVCPAG